MPRLRRRSSSNSCRATRCHDHARIGLFANDRPAGPPPCEWHSRITSSQAACSTTLHEVRSLTELTDRLKKHPDSLVLIEVTPENLEAALTWLADATSREKHLTAVALLDYRRTDNPVRPLFQQDGQDCPSYHRDIVATALREAGASGRHPLAAANAARSYLGRVVTPRDATSPTSRHPDADQSFENWAWSLLPWQDMQAPVRLTELIVAEVAWTSDSG